MKRLFKEIRSLFLSKPTLAPSQAKVSGKKKNGAQRVRNLYDPSSTKPYRLSRSKIELFMRCKRCFYIDRRLGVGHPDGYPFSLNIAVDDLLKKEFDIYRAEQKRHPLCIENKVNAIPFKHEDLEEWRKSLHAGVQYQVPGTNFMVHGGLDDVWINQDTQELIVVDYKATSKNGEVSLDADWQVGYRRQAEIYQWLLRKNGFKVSNIAYFVYCNGKKDVERFGGTLKFDISLLPYHGDDSWVQSTIMEVYECLQSTIIPQGSDDCDYCQYCEALEKII